MPIEINALGRLHQHVHVERVVAGRGAQAELPRHAAVDDGRHQGHRVPVGAEQRYAQEHVVQAVVVPVSLDPDQLVLEQELGYQDGLLPRCQTVDVRMFSAQEEAVRV